MYNLVIFFIVSLFYITLTFTLAQNNVLACNPNDLRALNDFKDAIQNDTSKRLVKWVGDQCCEWIGIVCDAKTGRVTEVNLQALISTFEELYMAQMVGYLSPSITLLSSLRVLHIGGQTGISGTIPFDIGFKLPELQRLILSGNNLTGPIPNSILRLTKLEELFLDSNALEGSIPNDIGLLKSLTQLYLSNNSLTGKIPTSVTNLSSLIRLDLSDNKLEGPLPSNLGNLSQLKIFFIGNNMLSGRIPKSIGELKALNYFNASHNKLQSPIPQEISSLQHPLSLDLSFSHIKLDAIPNWFATLPSFTEIYLAGCGIKSLVALQNRTNIRVLDLSFNNLTGSIPAWLGNNKDMFELNLPNNFLVGEIPTGGPFDSFPASSYSGNKALCGKPLPSCNKQI